MSVIVFLGSISLAVLVFGNEKIKPKTQISIKSVIPSNPQISKFTRKMGNRNRSVTTSSVYKQCILL